MLKYFYKKIHPKIKSNSRIYWYLREWFVIFMIHLKGLWDKPSKKKKRILFYYVFGLGYGGTSSLMQILAKHLNKEKYEVYIMYSKQMDPKNPNTGSLIPADSRLNFVLKDGVFPIPFDYERIDTQQPYFIYGMTPRVEDIIKAYKIDLLVVTGAGHAEFPFSVIKKIPIIFLNIFGQANMQKNIMYHLCISEEVANKLEPIVSKEKIKVIYVPTEGPMPMQAQGAEIRENLGIPQNDIVFGRVVRGSDWIFDPIGLAAFEKVVSRYPKIHYVLVAPTSQMLKLQKTKNIPNVHFLPEIGTKEGLWAFYYALDVYAHFRKDGESFGLNIVEAMFAGKPIISHKSHYWNAHLEYLDSSFAFVADTDNVEQYAQFMEFFAKDEARVNIKVMGEKAAQKAEKFHIRNHIGAFENYVKDALK